MKDITVLGAGTAGLALIEAIRAKNSNCNIRLIDKKSYHFSKNDAIFNPSDTSSAFGLNEWAKNKGVQFIEAQVDRVNIARKKIYPKNKESFTFDRLIVATGLFSKKISIRGTHREGFFWFSALDPFKLKDLLKISNEVCVYVSTLPGVVLSLALAGLGKEVRFVASNLDFLLEYKEKIIEILKKKNVFLHLDSQVEEAIGEASIKAAKLSPLKVFPSQVVFIDSGFSSNLDFFEEEIIPQNTIFTDFDDVYLLGDVSRTDLESESFFNFNHQGMKEQVIGLVDYLLEDKKPIFQKMGISDEDRKKIIENILTKM